MATSVPPRRRPPARARRDQAAVRAATHADDRIDRALRSYAARIERQVLRAPNGEERRRLIAGETRTLRAELLAAIADAREAVSEPGALRGTYEHLGPIGWRQRVTEYSREAAAAAARLATRAARGDLSPAKFSRALRSEVLSTTRYQARRIAVSEVFNASVENDLSRFALDPTVHAVRWVPTSAHPCKVCLTLANSDLYGLGAGVFPLARVPLPPHPFCRCRRRAVRGLSAEDVRAAVDRGDRGAFVTPAGLSTEQRDRLRAQLRHHLTQSATHASRRELEAAMALRQASPLGRKRSATSAPKGVPAGLMAKLRAGTLRLADLRKVDLATFENLIRAEPVEHLAALRGANVVFFRTGVRDQVSFSHAEALGFVNTVLTHNHPSGSPFSIEDAFTAIRYNVREIRAASERGIVQLPSGSLFDSYRKRRGAHVLRRDAGGYAVRLPTRPTPNADAALVQQLQTDFELTRGVELRRMVQEIANGQIQEEDAVYVLFGRVWRQLGKQYGFRYRFQAAP